MQTFYDYLYYFQATPARFKWQFPYITFYVWNYFISNNHQWNQKRIQDSSEEGEKCL